MPLIPKWRGGFIMRVRTVFCALILVGFVIAFLLGQSNAVSAQKNDGLIQRVEELEVAKKRSIQRAEELEAVLSGVKTDVTNLKKQLAGVKVKYDQLTVCVIGYKENKVSQVEVQNKQFKKADITEDFIFKVQQGRTVVGAWPVVRDFHARNDMPKDGMRRFWKDWQGYFDVRFGPGGVIVGGTSQPQGYFFIEIGYLYTEAGG
jgi:hypothetical protein